MSGAKPDVIVVGGGNAGFVAAQAAVERGRKVTILERAPLNEAGGNSFFTAGATRIAHNGLEELRDFLDADDRHERTVVPPYTEEDYLLDLERVTDGRNDPELSRVLASESQPTIRWLNSLGLRYRLMYERQAYLRADGSFLFWGGLHVGNTGGGEGLMRDHTRAAAEHGIEVVYGAFVHELIADRDRVVGVRGALDGVRTEWLADSVVIAAGGFEASAEWRRLYLGEGWQNAKVRGTPYNDGEMLRAALEVGAARGGDWHTAHSVQWDAFHPENEGNRELTNRLTRQSYPIGIIVNRDGERFLDEGADFRNYTYAKYGRYILEQPGSIAFQIFDAQLRPMLRSEEYDMPGISVVQANSIAELADGIAVPIQALEKTVDEFNAGINRAKEFDPTVKDARVSIASPAKSNWASAIETPPYYAYPVTCGITFTFGGLKTDTDGRVLNEAGHHIKGLFACGEALGGLFSGNYPGGSGLAAGAVFGRRAGSVA